MNIVINCSFNICFSLTTATRHNTVYVYLSASTDYLFMHGTSRSSGLDGAICIYNKYRNEYDFIHNINFILLYPETKITSTSVCV